MRNTIRGFTLVEMMVSVALFSVVMLVGMSALFTLVSENRRAQAVNTVITDLNFALESITRSIRTGYQFSCNGSGNCTGGGSTLSLITRLNEVEYEDSYRYVSNGTRGYVERNRRVRDSGAPDNWVEITSENVDIESFNFYVFGSEKEDGYQPRVLIVLSGTAQSGEESAEFSIQTTVTQRIIDL